MRYFVDSNVLVYSRDPVDSGKQARARDWLAYLWHRQEGLLSTQVLSEFYVTLTRASGDPAVAAAARADVRELMSWSPLPVDHRMVEAAWEVQDRFGFSWWDSLIVAAAHRGGCEVLLTEDLQHGQQLDGLRVVNPFNQALPEGLA